MLEDVTEPLCYEIAAVRRCGDMGVEGADGSGALYVIDGVLDR